MIDARAISRRKFFQWAGVTLGSALVSVPTRSDKTLKEMFTQRADTFDRAMQMALAKHGENAKVVLLKNGSDIIPRFEGR